MRCSWIAAARESRIVQVRPEEDSARPNPTIIHDVESDRLLLFGRSIAAATPLNRLVAIAPQEQSRATGRSSGPALGARATQAFVEIRALARMPTFALALSRSPSMLEEVLETLQLASDRATSDGLARRNPQALLALEREAVGVHDDDILTVALERAGRPWDFDEEHGPYRWQAAVACRCPVCGAHAARRRLFTLGVLPVERRQINCPRCFVICNVPRWPLGVRALGPIERSGVAVRGRFLVTNRGRESRSMLIALEIDSLAAAKGSPPPRSLTCAPRSAIEVPLTFVAAETPDNARRVKVFVASEGAFGFFSFVRFL